LFLPAVFIRSEVLPAAITFISEENFPARQSKKHFLMAEIIQSGARSKNKKRRPAKHNIRIDMTPMVDLAFLLLTFFVLTTSLSKLKGLDWTFPDFSGDPTPVKNGLTFLLTENDRVFYYTGEFRAGASPGKPATQLTEIADPRRQSIKELLYTMNETSFSQLQKLNTEKQSSGMSDSIYKEKVKSINRQPEALTVVIKTDNKARYANVVSLVDQLKILRISKFANLALAPEEEKLLLAQTAQ
jgi:biopolymer transport protein ExbD